jgi:hypothetical protein
MGDLLFIVLAGVALLIAAGSGALLLTYSAYAGGHLLADSAEKMTDRVSSAFDAVGDSADDKARHRRIYEEIMGSLQPPPGGIHRKFIQASEATKCINAALKATKTAMTTCCDVQRFTAQAMGATEMYEVTFDPVCMSLRSRVVDTIDVSVDMIEAYPSLMSDPRLLKQAIALKSLQRICIDCELLHYSAAQVPLLCTPAASM